MPERQRFSALKGGRWWGAWGGGTGGSTLVTYLGPDLPDVVTVSAQDDGGAIPHARDHGHLPQTRDLHSAHITGKSGRPSLRPSVRLSVRGSIHTSKATF